MQLDLLSYTPPAIRGDRDGETFDRASDGRRLDGQAGDVFRLMRDGKWRTLAEIASATGHPEASVSARLRDLRKPHLGGCTVLRQYIDKGLWAYRVIV